MQGTVLFASAMVFQNPEGHVCQNNAGLLDNLIEAIPVMDLGSFTPPFTVE